MIADQYIVVTNVPKNVDTGTTSNDIIEGNGRIICVHEYCVVHNNRG